MKRILFRAIVVAVPAALAFTLMWVLTARAAPAVNVIYVNSSADTSPCDPGTWTLRCAINFANSAADVTDIRFTVYTVILSDSLPTITHAGTWIDGVNGSDVVIRPLIDGSHLPCTMLWSALFRS